MITVNTLKPRCNADNEAIVISELFLTETHELCIAGYCSKCLKDIFLTIALSDLWDRCPSMATPDEQEADKVIGHALGVKVLLELPLLDPPLLSP
jgi:hypothetical protein